MKATRRTRRFPNYRVTPLAVILLVVLAGCIVVGLVGSRTAQIFAWLVAIAILGVLVGGGRAAPHATTSTMSVRGKTITQAAPDVLDEAPVDETAWAKERERRERDETRQPSTGL